MGTSTRVVGGQKNCFLQFGCEKNRSAPNVFSPAGGLELGELKYALVPGFSEMNF